MGIINICHRCKKGVDAAYDATYYKAYVCPHCRKPFTDTYGVDTKQWNQWSEEKQEEYVQASISGNRKAFFEKYPVQVDKKEQSKTRVVFFGIMAILLVVAFACFSSAPIVSIACLAIDVFMLCMVLTSIKDHGINYEMSNVIRYDADTCTLYMFKKDSRIAEFVKIKDDHNVQVKYEPEKLHAGAVTVGNVTTGGVYKTGGYNYVAGTSKSGYAQLEYKGKLVLIIELNDELYADVKKYPISKYLLPNTKQIYAREVIPYTEGEIQQMWNNLKTTGFAGNSNKGKLTFAQCEEILHWMCTK